MAYRLMIGSHHPKAASDSSMQAYLEEEPSVFNFKLLGIYEVNLFNLVVLDHC